MPTHDDYDYDRAARDHSVAVALLMSGHEADARPIFLRLAAFCEAQGQPQQAARMWRYAGEETRAREIFRGLAAAALADDDLDFAALLHHEAREFAEAKALWSLAADRQLAAGNDRAAESLLRVAGRIDDAQLVLARILIRTNADDRIE